MDGRDWNQFLLPYEQAVEELKVKLKGLRSEFTRRQAYSPIEFVTGRVKKISSILEKAKRYHIDMNHLEAQLEDIAGIRVMCQFTEDIETVAQLIRNRKDLTVKYAKDYINSPKESGYASYHLVISYPVHTSFGNTEVTAEIQIRTLAMNFWATIEHSLRYKYREKLPAELKLRLRKAAEAATILDQEMSAIREEIVESQKWFEDRSTVVFRVLNDIQELYFHRKVREAVHYQLRFNELFEDDDTGKWKQLSLELRQLLDQVKLTERNRPAGNGIEPEEERNGNE